MFAVNSARETLMKQIMIRIARRFFPGLRFFPGRRREPMSLSLLTETAHQPVARFLAMAALGRPESVFSRKRGVRF